MCLPSVHEKGNKVYNDGELKQKMQGRCKGLERKMQGTREEISRDLSGRCKRHKREMQEAQTEDARDLSGRRKGPKRKMHGILIA